MPAKTFENIQPDEKVAKFVGAYILGRALGKHKMRPLIAARSDHKTVVANHQNVMAELKFKAQIDRVNKTFASSPGEKIGPEEQKILWDLIVDAANNKTRLQSERSGESNQYIIQLVEYAKNNNNLLDAGDKLALWSGGVALSEYAQEHLKYCCLETSKLGGILNYAQLYRNDTRTWDLWDPLAEAFVEQVRGNQNIHIFVRTFDFKKSTLLNSEIPKLKERIAERMSPENAEQMFKFHVIVGDTDRYEEMHALTNAGKLEKESEDRQIYFDGLEPAKTALIKYLLETKAEDLIRAEDGSKQTFRMERGKSEVFPLDTKNPNKPGLMSMSTFNMIAEHLDLKVRYK